jgi:cysteinyl-tRNA synthetase
MELFNILLPSIGTCTTDYIEEIIKSIEQIINNDYGYISGSSVYRDVIKLQQYYPHET